MILDLDLRRHKLTPEALDSQSLQKLNEFHCVQEVSSPTSKYVSLSLQEPTYMYSADS